MAVSIFIKFPNGITGETQQARHVGEVAADSLSWGVARNVSLTAHSRETSLPTVSEVTFTKKVDSASHDLVKACLFATALDEITISFVKDAGDESMDYLVYTLKKGLISGYGFSGATGADTPFETYSISFTEIKGIYHKPADDHSAASDHEFEYDLMARV